MRNDETLAALARTVRAARQRKRWTLNALASRSGLSKGMLLQIESARTNPSIGTLIRIANAFGVSVWQLFAAQEDAVGAFVTLNIVGARVAADASTARWKAGATLSPIDGMPVGIKDIMETADMATEQGSPLFVGWHGKRDCAAVARRLGRGRARGRARL